MKLTRSTYFLIIGFILMWVIPNNIRAFSEELEEQLFLPLLALGIILLIIGIALAIKDKELLHVISDERTKRVDRSAVYYSWWLTFIFTYVYGVIAYIKNLTIFQYMSILLTVMLLSMILFHIYFNFKGEE
jgi:hypothetical protein